MGRDWLDGGHFTAKSGRGIQNTDYRPAIIHALLKDGKLIVRFTHPLSLSDIARFLRMMLSFVPVSSPLVQSTG
jgi:hypothetical protein